MEIPRARVVTGSEILAATNAMVGSNDRRNENKRDVAHGVCSLEWNNVRNIGQLFFLQRADNVLLRHIPNSTG